MESPLARKAASAAKPQKPTVSGVALIVRTLRLRAGLTLNELSRNAQVAASTISKIESGQLSPGYDVILRLAEGLGVDVAELFKPAVAAAPTGRRGVTRKGQGQVHDAGRYAYEALAGDVARKDFLPLVATIKARSRDEWSELPAHEGEELVYVLSGRVIVYSEHYEPLELDAGDSVYFDSRSGHALVSSSPQDAQILWISSHHSALATPEASDRDQAEF